MKYLKTICFTAFFLSGLASIVYELTWIRLLRNIFGSDSLAFSSLLTIFIGGIASGTFISGRLIKKFFSTPQGSSTELQQAIDKAKNYFFIIAYGLIELTVGVYALVTPFLLKEEGLGEFWGVINNLLSSNLITLSLAKFLIAGIVLIIPTLLLGLSYPVLVELVTSNESKSSSKYRLGSSNLYATNTMGSIAGSLIGGFFLIPSFGLSKSILIATLINFFITGIIFMLKNINGELFQDFKIFEAIKFIKQNAKNLKDQKQQNISKGIEFWLLVTIGVILGFSNLGLEVIWNKIFAMIIGSSVFSATIVISVVLAGISFGAYSLNYFSSKISDESLDIFLSINIVLFALAIFLSTHLLNNCPWIFLELNNLFSDLFNSDNLNNNAWSFANISKYMIVSLIIFPVTFLEGLAYAIVLYKASEISKTKHDPVGTRIAIISYWNTIGAILGSFSAGFILIPFFSQFGSGISNSIRFILVLAFICSVLSLFLNKRLNKSICMILIIIATISCSILMPSLAKNSLTAGTEIYKNTKYKNISKKKFNNENTNILFYKEGINSVVTVVEDQAANAIFLKNNGKIEAGIPITDSYPSKADTVTQTLLSVLPVAIKSDSKNALVIGMGSGKTVESLAIAGKGNHLKEITVCEIEKEVFNASEKFFVKNYPLKVQKKNIDARVYMDTSKESFDIIISQPSDPWLSGSLFTKEFWHKTKNKLSDKGIFIQWLQLYSINKEHLEIALRTFKDVFPETYVFRPPHSAELLLVGAKELNYFNIKDLEKIVYEKNTRKKLLQIGIITPEDLLATMLLSTKDIEEITQSKNEIVFNTDDNMSLELHTSKYIDNFNESVLENLEYLNSLANTNNLFKLFASFEEFNFLNKLSIAHSRHKGPAHKKLAFELANKLHDEHKSPLSYLALYEVYNSRLEYEKAESILYEASEHYQDSVAKINNQSVIFNDLQHDFHNDFSQYLALFKIFLASDKLDAVFNIQNLLKKNIFEKEKAFRDIYEAKIFYEKAQIQLEKLKNDSNSKEIIELQENIKRARRKDNLNYQYLKLEALLQLEIASRYQDQENKEKYLELARKNLEEVNELFPLDFESHLLLAEMIYQKLPKEQIKYMAKNGDEKFENDLKLCLVYLKNALELNAYSYKANLYMADLQYKLGNMDLCHRHIKRLESLCSDQDKCLTELGNDNKIFFDELNEKISKLFYFQQVP